METLKQFTQVLGSKIRKALDSGDVLKANEIAANIMVGTVILIMIMLCLLCLLLNEIGIFTADRITMRCAVLGVVVIEGPILAANRKTKGEPAWMRGALEWGLLAVCTILSATLGHNVTLVMVIPILLSIRYCDALFTRKIAAASVFLFAVACVGNAFFGIVNLNIYPVKTKTILTVTETLRNAVQAQGIDRVLYLKKMVINDFLPKLLIFSVIGFSGIRISQRGRDMTMLQDQITRKSSRIETELNLATEIQASMLPCIFPAFPDHGELELYACNVPAKEVGGDFYDYFNIDENHVAIVMADVSGKGVGAALFMTIAKIVLKNQFFLTKSPAEAMTNTNVQLCENNTAGLFVTAWAGIYEISSGTLTYVNAGHNPPIFRQKGQSCHYLTGKNGFVLAGLEGTVYSESTIRLFPGDEIFLYTDGVTEATSKEEELYGENRLLDFLDAHINEPIHEQIEAVFTELNTFMEGTEQFDDITMMGMRLNA